MRVNARFEGDAEAQIAYLAQATGMGVSDVLRTSVQHYYDAVRARRVGLKHLSAFVGQGDSGRSDIASTYKTQLAEGWGDKHRHPPSGAVHENTPTWPADRGGGVGASGRNTKPGAA